MACYWITGEQRAEMARLSPAPRQCGLGSIPALCHKWAEFVFGCHVLPRFFSGFSGFLPKTDISKFHFDQGRAPAREPSKTDVTFALNIAILYVPQK